MFSVIQVVTHASVTVKSDIVGSIQKGILALIGIEKTDTRLHAEKLIQKIIQYRVFPDDNGKMNLSLIDVHGGLLLVPQFTLLADTSKGLRPSFSGGMPPEEGKKLFEDMLDFSKTLNISVSHGIFGAYMQVQLCNDGPATFMLKA